MSRFCWEARVVAGLQSWEVQPACSDSLGPPPQQTFLRHSTLSPPPPALVSSLPITFQDNLVDFQSLPRDPLWQC